MLISTGIFAVVIITAVGAMLSINQAEIKALNIQNVEDNLRFGIESMTRELRTGTNFSVASFDGIGYSEIHFIRQDGAAIGYCLDAAAIKKFVIGGAACGTGSPVTSSAIAVSKMYFFVVGNAVGPADGQPRVTITVDAHSVNSMLQLNTEYNLQTTVTARLRDF